MPEGDTLRAAELALAPLLEGEEVEAAWFAKLRGLRPRAGQRILAVRAVGKHLQIDFDRNLTLDTHLGMAGWWRTLPRTAQPPSDHRLRIVLTVAGGHALCYAAPTIATFARDADPSPVAGLGPDLSGPAPDLDVVMGRIDELAPADRPVADVLLDQRVASGIGNVFKCEALFVARVDPFAPIGRIDGATRERLWRTAHRLLRANAGPGPRATASGGRLFVYGRHRLGCRRCDTPIAYLPAGRHPAGPRSSTRSTYWCPTCQKANRGRGQ